MSADQADYEKLVKDHLRMRLMESGWNNFLNQLVKLSIKKRVEGGQAVNSIKFEQLYNDVIVRARDAVSEDMEKEFHTKINEYFSFCSDQTASGSSASSPTLSPDVPPDAPSEVPFDAPSDVPTDAPSDVPSDIPLEVISQDYVSGL